ncbi:MAG TPA: serpin family protein [bacterium]
MFKNSFLVTLVLITCLVLFSQCAHNPVGSEVRELNQLEKSLVESDNKFGFKLFREIAGHEESNKNIFISPLSVSMALGMTLNGANGETQAAMEQTLEFAGMTTDDINQSYRSLIDLLTRLDQKVIFEIANSIWYRQEMTFEQTFMDVNQQYFDAVVRAMNFGDPEEAARIINSWVKDKTHGKIEEVIKPEQIDWATVMFLVNAIYFKGTWTYEFDKERTVDDTFTLVDGSQKPCRMMIQTNEFSYQERDQFQAIDLPYGDGQFSMTIFLPKANQSIDDFVADFTQEHWNGWLTNFEKDSVTLRLPKFTIECEFEETLKTVLTSLGMGIAFSGSADFTKMYKPGGLFIDMVIHKTFVEVNEEGTEAAAVTVVEMSRTSAGGDRHIKSMRVDRPFVFVIREQHSGTILFMGKIVEPKSE